MATDDQEYPNTPLAPYSISRTASIETWSLTLISTTVNIPEARPHLHSIHVGRYLIIQATAESSNCILLIAGQLAEVGPHSCGLSVLAPQCIALPVPTAQNHLSIRPIACICYALYRYARRRSRIFPHYTQSAPCILPTHLTHPRLLFQPPLQQVPQSRP